MTQTLGTAGAATHESLQQRVTVEQRRLVRTEIPGPRSRQLHEQRRRQVADGVGVSLPVFVSRAGGAILLDVDGNQLIDFASGIAVTSVGASHPDVVDAVAGQAEAFTHTCFLVTEYDLYVQVCARLNALVPGATDKRTALFSVGAEALENAVKIARSHTGRPGVIVFDHAYHGRTLFALGMTSKDTPYKAGFGPFPEHIHRAAFPYPLRWPTGPERAAEEALAGLEQLIQRLGPDQVAAVVVEPIQGEGGFVVPPDGFLTGLRELTARHGIVMIADEVQSGLGRTGTMFAVDHEGVVPDLICMAKALGGGLPLAAVTGRADIMSAVPAGGLGGTYAGNPLACAASLAVLDLLETGDLLERAGQIERVVREHLEPLVGDDGMVAEVRGRGAMMAVELCRPGGLEPDPDRARAVAADCHAQGLLALVCGSYGNVIRLLPPLVIDDGLLRDGLAVLAQALRRSR